MAYDRNNVFARIIRGELPCTKVHEDAHVLAFRDIRPQAPTHVVLIPKGEYVSADEFSAKASEAELASFMRAVAAIVAAEGIAEGGFRLIANTGRDGHQEVPHFHLHIVGGRDLGPMLRRSGQS
ncbi:MAG TPA: histidine triad nucleotide-binding protein [Stellaceae bacterium]|nr:histidine triad nucleotide-binding protein [Stellaceae bacterium]